MTIRREISGIYEVLGQEDAPAPRPPPEYAYYIILIVPGSIPTPLYAFEKQEDAEQWAMEQAQHFSGGKPVTVSEVRGEKRWKSKGRSAYYCMRYLKYDPWM